MTKAKIKTDADFSAAADHVANASSTQFAAGQLKSVIERIERLEEEKREVGGQIKEVYSEAKANGFCTKTMRAVVALRRKSAEERQEAEAMLDLYMHALGMAGPLVEEGAP